MLRVGSIQMMDMPRTRSSTECSLFQIFDASENQVKKIGVHPSTVDNTVPDEMPNGADWIFPMEGSSISIYASILIDLTTGEITESGLGKGPMTPEDIPTRRYLTLGMVELGDNQEMKIHQFRYGPADAYLCRDWFSDPVSYGIRWGPGGCGGGGY